MAKMIDVAREAGVSTATVSRVLNDQKTVDPALAVRVLAAAEKLAYRPNHIARSLRRQTTNVIALIISDVTNPFFTAITRGVEDSAQKFGYSVLLCNADENADKEATYIRVAAQAQVAGVILSPHHSDTDIAGLTRAHIPVVVVDRPLTEDIDSVTVHSFDGARVGTEHLLDAGWARPACITGPMEATTAQERLLGFRRALADRGRPEGAVVHGTFRADSGREATATLLDAAEPPDALFIANAQMTLGALEELKRRKLRIGHDIGIVTFDDPPWAQFVDPALTTVAQPAYQIGAEAAAILLNRIEVASGVTRHVTLPTKLIIRDSSLRVR